MLTIHDLAYDRIVPVATQLCAADLRELDAAGIEDATAMLRDALPTCSWAQEARWQGQPVAIFGVRPVGGDGIGVPWMLTTIHMDDAERAAVARAAVRAVRRMRAEFSTLINWVHAENKRAVRFIEWLGFEVEAERSAHHFRKFHWRRS